MLARRIARQYKQQHLNTFSSTSRGIPDATSLEGDKQQAICQAACAVSLGKPSSALRGTWDCRPFSGTSTSCHRSNKPGPSLIH